MKLYSEVTPKTQLMNNAIELDHLKSSYKNLRFGVAVAQVITIDARYQANLPGLAFDVYGDQDYWRAILAFNGLTDPINDVVIGKVIGLPDVSSLEAFMTAQTETLTPTIYV